VLPVGHRAQVLGTSPRGTAGRPGHASSRWVEQNIMTHTHGTPAQGRTIYDLAFKARKLRPGTTRESVIAKVQKLTQAEVQAEFDKLNTLVGFDRELSPATVKQGQYIADMLRKMDRPKEELDLGSLTYQEADVWIKKLKVELYEYIEEIRLREEAEDARITDIFTRREMNGWDSELY
jgi:hypothetical protein